LKKYNTRLKLQEKLLDLIMRLDAHIGGQQALPVPACGIDDRIINALEVDEPAVSSHLGIKGRLAVCEDDGEAELAGEEIS